MAGAAADLDEGLVVATHGRHCVVEDADGARRICHPRGKKSQAVVGDRVLWQASADEGTVERVQPRRNVFWRQDELRSKTFAANLDQVLVLIAAEPVFSAMQLSRALIAAEAAGIAPLVALNKSDLVEPFATAWSRLLPYRAMGYGVLPLSLTHAAEADRAHLQPLLQDKATLVLGPSGAGKSTLVNLLVPDAAAETGEISQALNSGKHTTTHTSWYWVPDGASARRTALIDSPGFQEFGLRHLQPTDLARCMPDLRAHAGACRFYNCTHLHEPGCGVLAAVLPADAPYPPDGHEADAPPIAAQRHAIYAELHDELSQPPRY